MTTVQTTRTALESHVPKQLSAIHGRPAYRPPCADGPDDWDMDAGNPDSWRSAVRICAECPLFTNCRQLAESLIERGSGPRAMIWAGVAYDAAGRVVENLDRHRVAPIDHKRPLRIIRNGARPVCTEPAPPTPRRRIVLGHRLAPTGTDE
ncbi:hypothetical protein [Nocardia macrotermitis]|uniref:4Fe-4S Wbl-type domain-containing protein n=1 Tax=Nocardia macrotermitis TaxID=2585198 RepID=A0A7K0DFU8_9NOCA|nr:hypothetical protein [Nocardia macrotermitis]MQY23654.1 hypothetical protein [Nocardia macrotermitis]